MARILVVDDSNFARRVTRQTLEQAGHEVIEASNGLSALEQVFLDKPALILLDLTMEDMGGLEVLEQLRSANNEIPVIVVSADIQDSTEQVVRDAGAVGFLGKPVRPAALLNAVSAVTGAAR